MFARIHSNCVRNHLFNVNLKIFVVLGVLLNSIDFGSAVKCYKCSVTAEKIVLGNATIGTPMCSKFDESDDYIVNCPFSTMCLKTISTLHLQNGQKQETETRGCAQQKDTTQVFRNKTWHSEHSVQEVYKEGCEEFRENNFAGSLKTNCYCRGNLCNTGNNTNVQRNTLYAIVGITMFLHWVFKP